MLVLVTAGTVEEAILARASHKRSLNAKVIQARSLMSDVMLSVRSPILESCSGSCSKAGGLLTQLNIMALSNRCLEKSSSRSYDLTGEACG